MKPKTVDLPETILFDPWLSPTSLRVWACYRHQADAELITTTPSHEIAELLGVRRQTVTRALAELYQAGYLERIGTGPSARRRLVIR